MIVHSSAQPSGPVSQWAILGGWEVSGTAAICELPSMRCQAFRCWNLRAGHCTSTSGRRFESTGFRWTPLADPDDGAPCTTLIPFVRYLCNSVHAVAIGLRCAHREPRKVASKMDAQDATPAPPNTTGETRLDRVFLRVYENPLAFAQLCCTAMLVLVAVFALMSWAFGEPAQGSGVSRLFEGRLAVDIPLVLLGVFSIVFVVTRTENFFALGMAVVIVGTIVAGEAFVLSATAILKGDSEALAQVSTQYGAQVPESDSQFDPNKEARRLLATINDDPADDQAVERVSQALQEIQLEGLLQELGPGTLRPLAALQGGQSAWQSFPESVERCRLFPPGHARPAVRRSDSPGGHGLRERRADRSRQLLCSATRAVDPTPFPACRRRRRSTPRHPRKAVGTTPPWYR